MNQKVENLLNKKVTVRSFLIKSFGVFINFTHAIAPLATARILRKHGFRAPRYKIGPKNQSILKAAQTFYIEVLKEKIHVYEWKTSHIKNETPRRALLIHGWGTSGLQLSSFVEPLLNEGFDVITFDHKGHGLSTSNFSSYIEFLRGSQAVIDHYQGEFDVVIGHSMGASVALKLSTHLKKSAFIAAIAPMRDVKEVLKRLSREVGISMKVMKSIVKDIENEGHWTLDEASGFNFDKLNSHKVVYVHDRHDYVNPFDRSAELHQMTHQSQLIETQQLGHNRILRNRDVIESLVERIKQSS